MKAISTVILPTISWPGCVSYRHLRCTNHLSSRSLLFYVFLACQHSLSSCLFKFRRERNRLIQVFKRRNAGFKTFRSLNSFCLMFNVKFQKIETFCSHMKVLHSILNQVALFVLTIKKKTLKATEQSHKFSFIYFYQLCPKNAFWKSSGKMKLALIESSTESNL